MPDEVAHREPVWRDRSNFLIAIRNNVYDERVVIEQLWARRLAENRYEICCIPFFAYDLALGDVVEADPDLFFTRVVSPSGRYVFRVFFAEPSLATSLDVVGALEGRGALVEWYSSSLLAVDAKDVDHAQAVADYLSSLQAQQLLQYETGALS